MTTQLARIVAQANIKRLSLIGLSKNVGKTTTTNHLLETLVAERSYRVDELALTSLGLDGEAVDALTGLPKPRYIPQEGLLVATTVDLLREGEARGIEAEWLLQLPGRTALGPARGTTGDLGSSTTQGGTLRTRTVFRIRRTSQHR
jgi:hypothetical protein